jgi:iron(III) transport system permease protein
MSNSSGALARHLPHTPTVLIVGVTMLLPLAVLILYGATTLEGGQRTISLGPLARVVTDSIYWQAFGNTVGISLLATLFATALGLALGWLFGRTDLPRAALFEQFATLPIFIPPFVGAVAWTLLSAPRIGAFNVALRNLGLPEALDIYTPVGMAWVIGIYLAPYVMMMVAGALRSMDPSLEEAARVSGLDSVRTAARITLPLIAPAILSGAVLAFTIAIGLFGTPVVLGWAKQILLLTSRIWISSQAVPPDYGAMAILAIYLIALSLIANGLQRWLLADRSFVTVTGKGFRPHAIALGRARGPCLALVIFYLLLTVVAPLAILLAACLSTYTWSGKFTLDNVAEIAGSGDVWDTLKNSIWISFISATIALVLGLEIAWLANRTRLRGRRILETLALIPVSVPGIAFGVGVMFLWLRAPVDVYGTAWIIILAFVGRFTAYAIRPIGASLMQVHPELEESARVAGFGWLRTLLYITLPLIRPSIVASWILLFSIFMTELSMVILLYTANTRTFSVLAFETWSTGVFSLLAGLSILQLLVGASIMVFVRRLFGSRALSSS